MRDVLACGRVIYRRDELLSKYSTVPPARTVVDNLRAFGIWSVCRLRNVYSCEQSERPLSRRPVRNYIGCYRGCRSGRSRRRPPMLRPAGNGAWIIVTDQSVPVPRSDPPLRPSRSSLLNVHVDRHSNSRGRDLIFGSVNINSLIYKKLDDVLDVRREQLLDVLDTPRQRFGLHPTPACGWFQCRRSSMTASSRCYVGKEP